MVMKHWCGLSDKFEKKKHNTLVNWMLCQEEKIMSTYTFSSGYPVMSDEKVLYPEQK